MSQLMTRKEAAESLRICQVTLDTLTKQGEITAVRIGSRVLYRPQDLEAFIEKSAVTK
jgi:excisionase family DNA binding protein